MGEKEHNEQYEEAYNCMIERRARGKVIITM